MEKQILLESSRSKFSVNVPNKMNIDLDGKFKLLQNDGIKGNFSLFEQYNTERDNCNKYRMIFVVNPVCTNALFNMQTEIVKDEGSDNPVVLTEYPKDPIRLAKTHTKLANQQVNLFITQFQTTLGMVTVG